MRRIVEHGLTHGLRQVWLAGRPTCPESFSSTPVPVQVEEFSPAIFLLFAGTLFALFVMALENFYNRCTYCNNVISDQPTGEESPQYSNNTVEVYPDL